MNWIQNTPDPYRFFQQIIQKDVVHNMDTYITREIKAFNLTAFSLSQLRNAVNTARHSCWLVSAHTGLWIYFFFLRKNFLNRSVSKTHWMDGVLIRLAIDRKYCDQIACVCSLIDQRWRQNVVRKKKLHTRCSRVYHKCSYKISTFSVTD